MVSIELRGKTLSAPVQITDPDLLRELTIFDGSGNNGTTLANAGRGAVIDWQAGIMTPPLANAEKYEVSFFMGPVNCKARYDCGTEKPRIVYVVTYAYDLSSRRGFIYLPSKGEPGFDLDSSSIWRGPGVAGHWFRATELWNSVITPLIRSTDTPGLDQRENAFTRRESNPRHR